MKRYLNSTYIKKSSVPDNINSMIAKDLELFGQMKRQCFSLIIHPEKMENGLSVHQYLKEQYGVSDYFVTAVEGAAKMVIKSQKELTDLSISDVKDDIKQIEKKLCSVRERRKNLAAMKGSIVVFCKSGCNDITLVRNFRSSGISFRGYPSIRVGNDSRHATIYRCLWDFEHLYLEPKIKRLADVIKKLRYALALKRGKLKRLEARKKSGQYSVYFGSRKLMHADIPCEQKEKLIRTKRCGAMTLSGRLDADGGNFMVRYDPADRIVRYRGASRKREYDDVGEIEFPYGQDILEHVIRTKGSPVAWTVRDCGNAWRFDVCVTLPDDERTNRYYGDGCIGIDINWDRIAVVETDGMGCPRDRRVIPLDMSGNSEQNRQAVSGALEMVFQECQKKHKPLAAEDIGNIRRKAPRYGGDRKKNHHISLFASRIIRELLESKSWKYGIGVHFVNPAYTSQTGKVKYMRRYGMSVHESAALTVGRRAMGLTDRIPRTMDPYCTQLTKREPRLRQWKHIYRVTKLIKPHDMFGPVAAKV